MSIFVKKQSLTLLSVLATKQFSVGINGTKADDFTNIYKAALIQ